VVKCQDMRKVHSMRLLVGFWSVTGPPGLPAGVNTYDQLANQASLQEGQ